MPGLTERANEQTAKAAREDPDRKEERGPGGGAPLPASGREAAARNDTVDVRMQGQGLSPRMKHAQRPGLEVKAGVCDVDERLAGGSEQQVVEDARRAQSDAVEHLGHGEDHVE